MSIFEGIILGIIQGLSEFLPISSSGHLVLFQRIFGLEEGVMSFDIALHFATLISVIAILWKEVVAILKKPFGRLPILIIVATIPTGIIGLALSGVIEDIFHTGKSLGFEFILTGLVLWFAESIRTRNKGIEDMTSMDAVAVGTAQGLAILPAISRSGLTIAGALMRGLSREFALKFSFLMSIPAILMAVAKDVYDTIKVGEGFNFGVEFWPFVLGMIAAAVSGYLAIRFMLKIFSRASFKVFSYYVFALGALVLIDQLFFGHFFGKLF